MPLKSRTEPFRALESAAGWAVLLAWGIVKAWAECSCRGFNPTPRMRAVAKEFWGPLSDGTSEKNCLPPDARINMNHAASLCCSAE